MMRPSPAVASSSASRLFGRVSSIEPSDVRMIQSSEIVVMSRPLTRTLPSAVTTRNCPKFPSRRMRPSPERTSEITGKVHTGDRAVVRPEFHDAVDVRNSNPTVSRFGDKRPRDAHDLDAAVFGADIELYRARRHSKRDVGPDASTERYRAACDRGSLYAHDITVSKRLGPDVL